MKLIALVLAVLLLPPLAPEVSAGDAPTTPSTEAKAYIENAERIAQVTDEQKRSLAKVFANYERELKAFMTENASKFQTNGQALIDAGRAGDQGALAAAQRANDALAKATDDIHQRFFRRRDDVFTPDQRAKLAAAVNPILIGLAAAPIKLTPAQTKSVQERVGTVTDPIAQFNKITKALDHVFTPEQRLEMKKVRAMKLVKKKYETAHLKPDQRGQLDAACDDLAKDATLDPPALAAKLIEKLESLLTPEEKKALLQPKGLIPIGGGRCARAALSPTRDAAKRRARS